MGVIIFICHADCIYINYKHHRVAVHFLSEVELLKIWSHNTQNITQHILAVDGPSTATNTNRGYFCPINRVILSIELRHMSVVDNMNANCILIRNAG